jgi:hypothetical protein
MNIIVWILFLFGMPLRIRLIIRLGMHVNIRFFGCVVIRPLSSF